MLVHLLQNRVDLTSLGEPLQEKVENIKSLNQYNPTNMMFRRFVKILQGVLEDCDDNSTIKEIMEERNGKIID